MPYGFRKPSLRKRVAARTSLKRYVRHSLGLKAPRGWGWLTNPSRAAYNRAYHRRSKGCAVMLAAYLVGTVVVVLMWVAIATTSVIGFER